MWRTATQRPRALREGSARAADAFDLLIGAPGSETQLVLTSVYLQPASLDLIDGLGRLGPETVTTGGVAVWAHVGGFVAGLVMAFFYTALVRPLPPLEFDEA